MRSIRRMLAWLACVVAIGAPLPSSAQSCSASASTVSFGTVSPIARQAVGATGSVRVVCSWPHVSLTPNVLVCLNLGANSPRMLANGANTMQYDLYQDAEHSLSWGSVYTGTTPISLTLTKPATGTRAMQTVTVYGRIPGNQATVPTVGNSSTTYSQSFAGTSTSLNFAFYLLGQPSCASLTTSAGTFPFSVNATVVNDCYVGVTNLGFAAAGVLSGALTATGAITAQCTNGDAWRIALSGGASGNVAGRAMPRVAGGGSVKYQLYSDAAHGHAWGDGTGGTEMVSGSGTGNPQTVTVYGVVPAQTTPAPGSYSDAVTATISF